MFIRVLCKCFFHKKIGHLLKIRLKKNYPSMAQETGKIPFHNSRRCVALTTGVINYVHVGISRSPWWDFITLGPEKDRRAREFSPRKIDDCFILYGAQELQCRRMDASRFRAANEKKLCNACTSTNRVHVPINLAGTPWSRFSHSPA